MPYTNTPTNDTYSEQRVVALSDIFYEYQNFAGSSGMINMLPFKSVTGSGSPEDTNTIVAQSRYGISATQVVGGTVGTSDAANIIRGMYIWEKTSSSIYNYVVVHNTSTNTSAVYSSSGTSSLTWTNVQAITDGTGVVRFTEFIDATNTKKLVMVDGTDGYVFTSNAAPTKITDADFPTPHVPFPVFLDGYLFLAKANTGDIYNSDLNDPAAWTAGSFISAEVFPDDIQALVKIKNYLLAIGTGSGEYFYDAANATGSPLARYEGANLPFGTKFPNSIAATKDMFVMLSASGDGESSLRIIEGLGQYQEVPALFLLDLLTSSLFSSSNATPDTLRGYFFRQRGQLFYSIAFNGTINSSTDYNYYTYPTYCFSFQTKLWVAFARGADATLTYKNYNFPVYFSAEGSSSNPVTYVAGQAKGSVFFGYFTPVAGFNDNIPIYGVNTSVRMLNTLTLPGLDFGTLNRKQFTKVAFNFSNSQDGATNFPETAVKLTWSFDPLALSSTTTTYSALCIGTNDSIKYDFPFVTQLGIGRKIWTKLEVYGSITAHSVDFYINKLRS